MYVVSMINLNEPVCSECMSCKLSDLIWISWKQKCQSTTVLDPGWARGFLWARTSSSLPVCQDIWLSALWASTSPNTSAADDNWRGGEREGERRRGRGGGELTREERTVRVGDQERGGEEHRCIMYAKRPSRVATEQSH